MRGKNKGRRSQFSCTFMGGRLLFRAPFWHQEVTHLRVARDALSGLSLLVSLRLYRTLGDIWWDVQPRVAKKFTSTLFCVDDASLSDCARRRSGSCCGRKWLENVNNWPKFLGRAFVLWLWWLWLTPVALEIKNRPLESHSFRKLSE